MEHSPSVLVMARHPVGGIRTWMEYVYGHPSWAGLGLTMLLPDLEEARELSRRLTSNVIHWHWAEPSHWHIARTAHELLRKERFDVVHAHGFGTGAAAAITASVSRDVKLIISCHDVIEQGQFSDWRGRLGRFALGVSFARADFVHAVSRAAAENVTQNFPRLNAEKLRIVPNGIDTARFETGGVEDPRALLRWPSDSFVIGFFGRFMNQKGFRVLLAAVEELAARKQERPVRLLAVGAGGFKAREQRYVAERRLEDHVAFVNFRPEIGPLLRSVDVVAMPSLWEACGLLAMEALVCGTPLICSDCPALADIAAGSPAQVVPRRDSAALAKAIEREMIEPSKEAARAYAGLASARFDVARAVEGIRRLYIS